MCRTVLKIFKKQWVNNLSAVFAFSLQTIVHAAPGDVLFSDNFSRTALAPWTASNTTAAGILTGAQTSGSNPRAAYTRNTAVTVTSPSINAAVAAARLDIWVRRGSNSINNSDGPENGEDLFIEYRTAGGTWNTLIAYAGSGTSGQIYNHSFVLPGDALHNNLAIRARQTQGSGFDFDYWHFDDVVITEIALSGPLAVGICDYFENGLSTNWTVNSGGGTAGVNSATFSSPSHSLFLNGGVVEVVSAVVDTTDATFSDVAVWVRRGRDRFSEDPDSEENLVIEYLNDLNNWIVLETFPGAGRPGGTFVRSYPIPADGRHTGFRLRIRMTGASEPAGDFWHVDDVCLTQSPDPFLEVTKVASILSDPVNGSNNPKAIPGAFMQYTIDVTNIGIGNTDSDSLVLTDPIPANMALYVTTASGDPITFTDGSPSSGLSYNFATDVTFSNQVGGGAPYNYTPSPDGQGFDPAVTGYRIAPTGTMNPDIGSGSPSFSIVFRVRIE